MIVTPSDAPSARDELLTLLACPDDGGALDGWDGLAEEAALTCATCGRSFPVCEGVPCLLPAGLAAPNNGEGRGSDVVGDSGPPIFGSGGGHEFGQKRREMAARDAQVADYDRMLGLRLFSLPEIPLTLRYLQIEPDSVMLEAGCGTGRMTPAFAERARALVCADLSFASLRAARAKLSPGLAARVLFVQADLSHLPLRSEVFDRVGSFQVLEHVPTPEARARAVAEMARTLKPRVLGGRLALSAYRWGPPLSLLSAKEGHHDGGIYFFRSTWDELDALLRPHIDIRQHTGSLLYHYLVWCRKHP